MQALFAHPHAFDFYQAVRLLEWAARDSRSGPGNEARSGRVGESGPAHEECVRFGAEVTTAFPPAAISDLTNFSAPVPADQGKARPAMTVAFMGLIGPSGVLPQHYTFEALRALRREKTTAMRDFFDVFTHRMVALHYRAWKKYRLPPSFEGAAPADRDPVTAAVASLVGLGTGGLRQRLAVDDLSVFFYGGHYARIVPSAVNLEALIGDFFSMPAAVEQFRGRWVPLLPVEQSALPSPQRPEGVYAHLDRTAVAGAAVWDAAGAFRVRIGPMRYDAFLRFLPGRAGLAELCDLARLYTGPELDFDVQCVIRRDEVPTCTLMEAADTPPLLGWNTWLFCADRQDDAGDPVFVPPSA